MTGPDAVSLLPPSIRVGAFDMAIVQWPNDVANAARCWGVFDAMSQEIKIQSGMPSAEKAVDTFVHELIHAIYFAYVIYDEDREERTVSTMGRAWTQIYRDNPWFPTWIGMVLHDD